MVITDIDCSYTSREATGRFQVALATHYSSNSKQTAAPDRPLPIHLELQYARDRAQAITASRRIDQTYRQH